MNEVHGKLDRPSQGRRSQDRAKSGRNRTKLTIGVVGAAVVLFAAAWTLLALSSHLRLSAAVPAPASPWQTVSASSAAYTSAPKHSSVARATSALSSLPLIFEPNVGQSDPGVKFLARAMGSRGLGYSVFLGADGVTMSLLRRNREGSESRPQVEALRMKLAGANPQARVSGISPLPGKSNYFLGNDSSRWHREVPQFARVRYENIYPGINLVFYGSGGEMEYDFQVAPGSDPAQAELQFEGARGIELQDGNLILHGKGSSVCLRAPQVYQRAGDRRQPVAARYQMHAANRVGFAIGPYDRSRELVIDPVLDYSTYFGGSGDEQNTSIAVDGSGNIYLAGSTTSPNLPVSATPFQATLNGTQNVYVLKINSSGTSIGYLTYLGGSGADTPAGIAVDASGNAYLAGTTSSPNFPTTSTNAYQAVAQPGSSGTTHVFVTALGSAAVPGSTLNYSSYLSGNGTDAASGVAIDSSGDVFVTGTTTSNNVGASNVQFPASAVPETQAYQQYSRAPIQFFVTKVNTRAFGIASIPYSTYFGGGTPSDGIAVGGGITVDGTGNIYFSGTTNFLYTGQSSATDFPILDAYQPCLDQAPPAINTNPQTCTYSATPPTATDAFVAKLNPNLSTGSQLIWSTYFGGSMNDSSTGVAVDAGAANVFIVGTTNSADVTTLTTFGSYQPCLNTPPGVTPCSGNTAYSDAYVARFDNLAPTTTTTTTTEVLALDYFSYLGGSLNDAGLAIAVDTADDAFLTGWTQSTDFPIFPNAASNPLCTTANPCVIQGALKGTQDAFLAHLTSTSTSGQNQQGAYATFFGGTGINLGTSLAIDNNSNVYLAGSTNATDFQTQNPLQPQNNGGYDAFAAKFGTEADLGVSGVITLPSAQAYVGAGNQATFTYQVTNSGPDLATQVTFSDDLSRSVAGMPLNFVSATAQSGSCSATTTNSTVVCTIAALQPASTSTVTVVVVPTTAGNFTGGAVTVYSAGNNDPNPSNNSTSVNAQAADFSVAINPSNQSIAEAGDTAAYQVTVTPIDPYPNNISLTCCTNTPSAAKGTFSLSTVTLSTLSPVTSQLNITTTARPQNSSSVKRLRQFYALWLSLPGMAVIGFGWKSGRRRIAILMACCLVFGMLLLQPACGGATTPTPTSGTPTGTYSLVATATSGTDTKNITFTLTVP